MSNTKIPYSEYLLKVRAILIYLEVIPQNKQLDEKSWLHYYEDGYSPLDAIQLDMDLIKPPIRWSKVHAINTTLSTEASKEPVGVFKDWMEVSVKLFPLATWQGSLIHAKEELQEIIDEPDNDKAIIEFADVFMCLCTSLAKRGFSLEQLETAMHQKAEINKARTWRFIEDGKYYKHKTPGHSS